MIKIGRTYPAPARLLEHGAQQTECDSDAYDQSPNDYISRREHFPNRTYYNDRVVKDVLIEMHHWKCCYCEAKKYERGELQIEHFRPKGAVRQSVDDRNEYPGYYWLAYSWENLLLACQACNTKKGTKFPLSNPDQRARSHHDDLKIEQILFVNPAEDDPRDHIRFQNDTPYPLTERGRQTINDLELRRDGLTEERLRYVGLLNVHLDILKDASGSGRQGLQQEAERVLKKSLQQDEPFSAMIVDLVNHTDILAGHVE